MDHFYKTTMNALAAVSLLMGLTSCSSGRQPASHGVANKQTSTAVIPDSDNSAWLKTHSELGKHFGFKENFLVRTEMTARGMEPVSVSDDYYKKLDDLLGKIEVEVNFRLADGTVIKKGSLGWEAFFEFYFLKLQRERLKSGSAFVRPLRVGQSPAEVDDVYVTLAKFQNALAASKAAGRGVAKEADSTRPVPDYRQYAPFKLHYKTTDSGIAVLTRIQ